MNASYAWDPHGILRKIGTGILLGALLLFAGCQPHGITTQPPSGGPLAVPPGVTAVPTYHYDNLRSGWNSQESQLNYTNVNNTALSVQAIHLDDVNDLINGQPLIALKVQIAGAKHDVVYVATEANNIYAFDAYTGARLKVVNLGAPVQTWCQYNGPVLGIDGTPAIDLPSGTMYVITYNPDSSNNPSYFIHALDLATLTDKVPPRQITASQKLSDGSTFSFNAKFQRQRPGLLVANGNVYAGFGGFCDSGGGQARGWVLGWQAGSLTPLPANLLTDTLPGEPNGMFLSGVWMSGYGIAGDQNGNIYFSTGNSDPGGTTYDSNNNISDSVVRLNPDLTRPTPTSTFLFTPANVAHLDQNDLDMSAGGVMLLPPQPNSPNMAVATGKDGRMFLLNRDNLGGQTANDSGALNWVNIGGPTAGDNRCWCATAYFNDGTPHIVSSGGTSPTSTVGPNPGTSHNNVGLWNLQTSPTPTLTQTAWGKMPDTIQDPGFFTTVSSNGNNNAIIWAVSRPQANSPNPLLWLYAFKATPTGNTLTQLFQSPAGSWPYPGGNANIVPVVANGKVYVGSYKELDIFGLTAPSPQGAQKTTAATAEAHVARAEAPEEHQVSGVVLKIDGNRLTIQTRTNKTVEIDATEAKASFHYSVVIPVGDAVVAVGSYDANGVMHAAIVYRTKRSPTTWPPDH